MTSGDMKVELNEDREIVKTIPISNQSNNFSGINPNAYDRNTEEIGFIDPDLEYDPDNVFYSDEPDEEYDEGYGLKKFLK